jgi:hypothetical protein
MLRMFMNAFGFWVCPSRAKARKLAEPRGSATPIDWIVRSIRVRPRHKLQRTLTMESRYLVPIEGSIRLARGL